MFIEPDQIGERLRTARTRRGLSQRKLARLVGVSPSLISQMEAGKVQPSVATLMAVVTQLGLSIDELFRATGDGARPPGEPAASAVGGHGEITSPLVVSVGTIDADDTAVERGGRSEFVQRAHDRATIRLSGGVVWERLTPDADRLVDFLLVTYEPGACSSDSNHFQRHEGRDYLFLLSGQLEVQIAFESFVLDPGDSIAYDSMRPHRLTNNDDEPAVVVVAGVHP